jgi:DNA-binding CsgD family transcriptional regulator
MTILSAREMEVARLVADDLSDKEIAALLIISERTVQRHLDNIEQKIGTDPKRSRRRIIARWVINHETKAVVTIVAA